MSMLPPGYMPIVQPDGTVHMVLRPQPTVLDSIPVDWTATRKAQEHTGGNPHQVKKKKKNGPVKKAEPQQQPYRFDELEQLMIEAARRGDNK